MYDSRPRPLRPCWIQVLLVLLASIATLAGCGSPEPAAGDVTETETPPAGLVLDTPEAAPGYVLFSPLLSSTTYLVDRQGRAVHTWESEYAPAGLYLLDDGTLLRAGRDPDALGFKAGGVSGIVQKIAWDGTVTWQWKLSNEKEILHHDIEPMPNGNFLAIGWEVKSRDEAQRAGRDPEKIAERGLWPDFVVEVEPLPDNEARIVWRWDVWDHLVQDRDQNADNYGDRAEHPGRIDLNPAVVSPLSDPEQIEQLRALGYIPEEDDEADGEEASDDGEGDGEEPEIAPDFLHVNAIAYHPGLDQIALSVPETGEIWIIDHGITTEEARGPAGDLLYRWGNPRIYGRGDESAQRLFYQHDVKWIPEGFERAGNLTLFNNGGGRPGGKPFSEVLELEPPLTADGSYAREADGRWGPAEPVWSYSEPESFFAPFISGAQRLANGNTLVCSGPQGRLFEVDPEGAVVWEYYNPYHGNVRNRDGSAPQPVDQFNMAVFRATHVAPGHPAIAGRTLAPLDPQPSFGEPLDYEDEDEDDEGEGDQEARTGDDAPGSRAEEHGDDE